MNFLTHTNLNLRIIDSINFVQRALSSFPSTFGLRKFKKGYFPHFFNKQHNQNHIGSYPSTKNCGYNQMETKARNEFMDWYDKRNCTSIEKFSQELFE